MSSIIYSIKVSFAYPFVILTSYNLWCMLMDLMHRSSWRLFFANFLANLVLHRFLCHCYQLKEILRAIWITKQKTLVFQDIDGYRQLRKVCTLRYAGIVNYLLKEDKKVSGYQLYHSTKSISTQIITAVLHHMNILRIAPSLDYKSL